MLRARILRLRVSATLAIMRTVLVVLAQVAHDAFVAIRKAWTL